MSDEELVKKAKTGDQRAFEVLVRKYQQRIFALISRYVRDHDEVQDVVAPVLEQIETARAQSAASAVTGGGWRKD